MARFALDHPFVTGFAFSAVAVPVVVYGGGALLRVASAIPVAEKVCEQVCDDALQVGQSFGKLGTVIENVSGKITGFNHDGTYHGLDQIITRGISPQALLNTVQNPLISFAGRFDRIGYLSERAYVVLDKAGQVVTALSPNQFGPTIRNVLNSFR